MIRRFLIKFFLFITIVLAIQLCLPLPDELKYKTAALEASAKINPDVMFFGDSTISWVAPGDTDNYKIPALLKSLIPDAVVGILQFPAYQLDAYYTNIDLLITKGSRPKFIIIPINLSSFSPTWYRHPLWQFEEDKNLMFFHKMNWMPLYKPLSVFNLNKQKISDYDYKHTKVYHGEKNVGIVRDFDNESYKEYSDENMRNKLIIQYMYNLEPSHPYIKALKNIVTLCKRYEIVPIFYITPIDYQTGLNFMGPDFAYQVKKNIGVITATLQDPKATLLDLSMTLNSDYFSWKIDKPNPLYPDEHLRLTGRMKIAQKLYEMTPLRALNKGPSPFDK